MSSMRPKKGSLALLQAFLALTGEARKQIRIDFAGRFDSHADETAFREQIEGFEELHYHGVVDDDEKKALFAAAHVLCLPTEYFEGQPISILEAYASGCVVVATVPSGIRDIFTPGMNGFEVQPRSPQSIAAVIDSMLLGLDRLLPVALANHDLATEKFRASTYAHAVQTILESE